MSLSRRDLTGFLSVLAAAHLESKEASASTLPSECFRYSDLPVKTNPETHTESRQVFRGETHGRFEIACHITRLAPGVMSHPPHRHVNEEVVFLKEGSVEITINGVTKRLDPGAVAYIHSDELHGMRNPTDRPAEYFILELDGQKT